MKAGDYVYTPRFCNVKIKEIFNTETTAREFGFEEPTHYNDPDYDILGKSIGTNRMIFAAVRK